LPEAEIEDKKMKRILMQIIFGAFLLAFCFNAATNAQHGYTIDKQVKFAAGKTAASYKSRLTNRLETHTYHLKAAAGKTLYVQLASKNPEMTFQIFDSNDNEIGSAGGEKWFWEGELNASGEFAILVVANRGAGNYTLNVRLK
jgi:hypothetical protein